MSPTPTSQEVRRLLVENVRVVEAAGRTYEIVFDLRWRRAIRYGDYWNAAWVFLKYNPAQVEAIETEADLVDKLVVENVGGQASASERARAKDAARRGLRHQRPPTDGWSFSVDGSGDEDGGEPAAIARSILDGSGEASPDRKPASEHGEASPESPRPTRVERSRIEQGQEVEIEDDFAFLDTDDEGQLQLTSFTRWLHMRVSSKPEDHVPRQGVTITPTEDGLGVFIYRDADHPASDDDSLELRELRVRTQIACTGRPLKVWVGALEMVRVPEGPFHLGDPAGAKGPKGCFYRAKAAGEDKTYVVESEAAIAVGESRGQLCWDNAGQMGELADIPAEFPKGYRAFYVMAHQVTQGEYCDFINHLQGTQLTLRYPYGGQGFYRFAIYKTTKSTRVCTRPERACNWLAWADASAYLWWAGLRPLTELEYEKACRGPEKPVANEYAWGSSNLVESTVIVGDESGAPVVQGNANLGATMRPFYGGDGGQGPVPDDAFALSRFAPDAETVHPPDTRLEGYTWREQTGGSYYAVRGLSGNLWEYLVSAGIEVGRGFCGETGTGNLTHDTGLPDAENTWPLVHNHGVGYRGGSWFTDGSAGMIADRRFGSGLRGYTDRSHDVGIRGARTAPAHEIDD